MYSIVITEHEQSEPLQLEDDERLHLDSHHKNHLSVEKRTEGYVLKANHYVGFIGLNKNKTIYIKPKVPDDNLFYILSYLYEEVPFDQEELSFDKSDKPHILNLIVFIFLYWVKKLIKRGLYKNYQPKEESISRVRGKIIPLKNTLRRDKIFCCFEELNHSSYENRIIKSTLRKILTINEISASLKNDSKKLLKLLSEVEDINLSERVFHQTAFTRLNRHYSKIIQLCYLIYKNTFLFQSSGDVTFQGFLVDMNKIFENFIRQYLINNLHGRNVAKRKISSWAEGERKDLLPSFEPDIVIENELVIDAKYYKSPLLSHKGKERLISGNLYQILFYMDALGLDGLLLYPENEQSIETSYITKGNKRFSIKTLKLDGTREDLNRSLKNLLDFVSDCFSTTRIQDVS